jgi:hypothetical protein
MALAAAKTENRITNNAPIIGVPRSSGVKKTEARGSLLLYADSPRANSSVTSFSLTRQSLRVSMFVFQISFPAGIVPRTCTPCAVTALGLYQAFAQQRHPRCPWPAEVAHQRRPRGTNHQLCSTGYQGSPPACRGCCQSRSPSQFPL